MAKFLKYALLVILVLIASVFIFMQQPSFGKLPDGRRLDRIKSSANYRDGKFQNIEPTAMMAEGVSYFGMIRDFFGKGVDREPQHDLPVVRTNLRSLPDDGVLVWFGHSSFFIRAGGKNILVDPVFSLRPSPVQFAGSKSFAGTMAYSADDFPDLDVVVITHDHYDHLDYSTIIALKDRVALFCVPLGVGAHLAHWGVAESSIIEFDWWESREIGIDLRITSTPARHFSGRGLSRDKTLWSSWVLNTGTHNLFLGGDSGYSIAFREIGEKYGPFDLALLECGQYDAKWPSIHMMPEETVQASLDLKAEVLLPIHWAKFKLGLHPWKEPIQRALAAADSLHVTVATPRIGQPVHLGQPLPSDKWWE